MISCANWCQPAAASARRRETRHLLGFFCLVSTLVPRGQSDARDCSARGRGAGGGARSRSARRAAGCARPSRRASPVAREAPRLSRPPMDVFRIRGNDAAVGPVPSARRAASRGVACFHARGRSGRVRLRQRHVRRGLPGRRPGGGHGGHGRGGDARAGGELGVPPPGGRHGGRGAAFARRRGRGHARDLQLRRRRRVVPARTHADGWSRR